MAYDIHGNDLQKGHCEVHPWVHQEYPCSICYSERETQDRQRLEQQRPPERDYQQEHIDSLKEQVEQLTKEKKELADVFSLTSDLLIAIESYIKSIRGRDLTWDKTALDKVEKITKQLEATFQPKT